MSKVVGQAVIPVTAMNDGEFALDIPAGGRILSASFVPLPPNGVMGLLMWVLNDTAALLVSRRFLLLDTGKPTLLLDELAFVATIPVQTPEGLAAAHLFELVKPAAPVILLAGRN